MNVHKSDRDTKHQRGPHYLFNPYEIAICGFKNSGKTTLATSVISALADTHDIGYAKHDGHRFEMDHPGKDTHRAAAAGARTIRINDDEHHALIHRGATNEFDQRAAMLQADVVIAEGCKRANIDKIVMLDDAATILDEELENVIAYVGTAPSWSGAAETPYFQRDDVAAIVDFVTARWAARVPPLRGLVLTGGRSTRMQQDKSGLQYHGVSQTEFVHALLAPHMRDVLVSTRAEQADKADHAGLPQLHDRFHGLGPIGGILTAMQADPAAAWLVVACDLPFLESGTFEALVSGRNPFKPATAFRGTGNGLPEPLCAIYEPKARYRLHQFVGLGCHCPRKVLINSDPQLLDQANPQWLDNVNTPEELEAALAVIAATATKGA